MRQQVRCLHCNVSIVAFGGRDLAHMVIDHLRDIHGHTPTTATSMERHPSNGGAA